MCLQQREDDFNIISVSSREQGVNTGSALICFASTLADQDRGNVTRLVTNNRNGRKESVFELSRGFEDLSLTLFVTGKSVQVLQSPTRISRDFLTLNISF